MTVIFTRQSETWSKHSSFPSNTATVSYTVYNEPAEDITTDEAIAAATGALAIGGQLSSPGVGPSVRPLFCKEVTWSQTTPKLVSAIAKYDSTLFIPGGYDEDTVQSVDDGVAGYVNTAMNATTYGVSWWRYQSPSAWFDEGTDYPWTTSTPSASHQVLLLACSDDIKVDAGGTPLKRPILGQQLTVSLTFETKPTALRAEWRSLRGLRNNAAFLGDATGEWLFTGANQRASTDDTLYAVELTFYRDPFGFCRQRAESGPNGQFRKDIELEEITNPAETNCGDGTDTMLVASCVDWIQLHPELGNFADLFTAAQLAQVVELIA